MGMTNFDFVLCLLLYRFFAIRSEIWKKKSLSEAARKSKSAETVAALQSQSEYVDKLISESKISWLAAHPELEAEWLSIIAQA